MFHNKAKIVPWWFTCIVTTRSSTTTSFVRKSAPIVALYWLEKRLFTYWFISDVFPTLESPKMMTFSKTFFLVDIIELGFFCYSANRWKMYQMMTNASRKRALIRFNCERRNPPTPAKGRQSDIFQSYQFSRKFQVSNHWWEITQFHPTTRSIEIKNYRRTLDGFRKIWRI